MPGLDDVIQRYRDYGAQTQAPLPPPALTTRAGPPAVPQYTIPNAFQTPPGSVAMYEPMSSQNAYEAQVASRFSSQMAMYSDPSAAAGNISGRRGRQVGEDWGGTIGMGLGLPFGGAGATAGGVVGDIFGGGIGSLVGRVGGAIGDIFSDTRQQQAAHMSMATNIQAGTMGHLMLGAGEAGLGGRGMNMQTAGKLAQRLTSMGQQQGMSREDMTNLTRAAGELNFLDQVTNTDQIFETVKKLTQVVGVMGKLTGDPDIMRNLKEIANLRAVGLNIDQAVQATEQIDMAARGMGMNRFQAMTTAGAAGMGVFRQAGMTQGVGLVQGVGAGALARMGAAGLDERQLALAGGVPGLTNTFLQQNARFAQGPGNLMMLAGLSQGAGGEFGLQGDFGQQLMGRGSFAGRLQRGLGNVRTPGQLIQFMGQQRELQTEMMEQMGPFGAQLSQARLIENLSQQMPGANKRERVLMAASMVTGSPEAGLTLMRTLGSSQFRERATAFIDEEIRRTKFKGAQEAAEEREARGGRRTQRRRREMLGRGALGWMGEAVGYLDEDQESIGSIGDLAEAEREEQEAQDKLADEMFEEMTGLERTTKRAGPALLARPVERERKRAERMMKAGWKLSGLGQAGRELGGIGVSFDYDEDTKQIKVKEGRRERTVELMGRELTFDVDRGLTSAEQTAADLFMGEEALSAGWTGGFFESSANIREQRQGALQRLRKTGERIQETKKVQEKDWNKGLKTLVKKMGVGATTAMRKAAVEYARSLDETGGGVDTDAMFDKMARAFAKEKGVSYNEARAMLADERKKVERWGVKFIEDSGDPAALDALRRSEDAAGTDLTRMSAEDLENFREDADERMAEAMSELGFAERGAEVDDISSEQRAAFDTFRGLSTEDQALALGILAEEGGTATDKVSDELTRMMAQDPKRYKRVREAARKMKGGLGSEERERLETKAGRYAAIYGKEELAKTLEEGVKGEGPLAGLRAGTDIAMLDAERRRRGQGDVEYEGEGAGAETAESRAKVSALERQREQLESLPEILGEFPDAVKSLKEAAETMKNTLGESSLNKDKPFPGIWGLGD